jgi:DNA-binding MarR family transcriptional regulator
MVREMSKKESLEHYLKLIMEKLDSQEKIIRNLEKRISQIESFGPEASEPHIQPSLIRVLKGLADEERPRGIEEIAKKLNLSRNLTSNYLKRLSELGYVVKEPNLERYGPRYLFKVNLEAIPDNLKKMLLKKE